jgi:branched-chain amino acid transport system permease protein
MRSQRLRVFSGVGGALLGHFIGVLNPDSFYLDITFLMLAMLVLGGIGTLTGAVLGAALVSLFIEILIRLERGVTIGTANLALPGGSQEIAIGVAMIFFLIFRPVGISGGKELRIPEAWLTGIPKLRRAVGFNNGGKLK